MVFWADEITVLFLGEKYADAVPIVQILFLSVAFRSVTKIGDSVVRALDRVYTASAIKALFLTLVGLGTYFGLSAGLKGVAWAIVIAVVIQFFLMMSFSMGLAGMGMRHLFKKLAPGCIGGLIVGLASLTAKGVLAPIEGLRLVRIMVALVLNGSLLFALAWFLPLFFRQGDDNILQTIANRLPLKALKRRWNGNH
jgi:O-antigen/teichoic acid export membrane protein